MSLFLSVLEQGLIYAILALGVYITFKILDFPDMSVDSTFPLGAAVTALHRLSMGALALDEALAPGECRPITAEEQALLRQQRVPE